MALAENDDVEDEGGEDASASLGTAWLIRAAAFLIPLVLVIALVVAGVRRWRAPRRK